MDNKILPVIYDSEWELMMIIWDLQNGVRMKKLVEEGSARRGWARTTVYTMVQRMADRGILFWDKKDTNLIYAKYTIEEYRRDKLRRFVAQYYGSDAAACRKDLE